MMMRFQSYLIPVLLLGAAAYAIAEEITLTTYYPSPRGVYKELRTTDNTYLATDGGRVGIGTGDPQATLDVRGPIHTSEGIGRTTCPAGMNLAGLNGSPTAFCVEANERPLQTWINAVATCRNLGRRLCTPEEFAYTCSTGSANGMNDNWEFTSMISPRFTESLGQAWSNQMGGIAGSCTAIGWRFVYEPAGTNNPANFRCCQ